jgi:hypothetical protein
MRSYLQITGVNYERDWHENCIITGAEITEENDSKAHIIPSALGGRAKPREILSKCGNAVLEEKFDFTLIEAFETIMNILNGSRDRGAIQPTAMTDEDGKAFIYRFGEPISLSKPRYEETPSAEGVRITVHARSLKEARVLLGRVKAKYPGFDIEEAMGQAVLQ